MKSFVAPIYPDDKPLDASITHHEAGLHGICDESMPCNQKDMPNTTCEGCGKYPCVKMEDDGVCNEEGKSEIACHGHPTTPAVENWESIFDKLFVLKTGTHGLEEMRTDVGVRVVRGFIRTLLEQERQRVAEICLDAVPEKEVKRGLNIMNEEETMLALNQVENAGWNCARSSLLSTLHSHNIDLTQ